MRNSMLRSIISLAWPTMLEQFSQTVVQYADTAMVGTLGTAATAAVGATSTVSWLIGSTVSAISIGFLAFISSLIRKYLYLKNFLISNVKQCTFYP